eukprot:6175706-Pleurochrysis_carterae.AAC.1
MLLRHARQRCLQQHARSRASVRLFFWKLAKILEGNSQFSSPLCGQFVCLACCVCLCADEGSAKRFETIDEVETRTIDEFCIIGCAGAEYAPLKDSRSWRCTVCNFGFGCLTRGGA